MLLGTAGVAAAGSFGGVAIGSPSSAQTASGQAAVQQVDVAPVTVAPGLEVLPRAAWAGADRPPKGEAPEEDVRFLLVHHTADRLQHEADEVPAILQGYYDFHTGEAKGWPDVAYNFMIDRYGRVWETHDGSIERRLQGFATGGNQGFSQLVCLIGDFTNEMPSDEALAALTRTLAWLAERDGVEVGDGATTSFVSRGSNRHAEGVEVTTKTITGHRAMSQTSCPGDAFFGYVDTELPDLVAAHRASVVASTVVSTSAPPSTAASSTAVSSTAPSSTSTAPAGNDEAAAVALSADRSGGGASWLVGAAVVAAGLALVAGLVRLRRPPASASDSPPSPSPPASPGSGHSPGP